MNRRDAITLLESRGIQNPIRADIMLALEAFGIMKFDDNEMSTRLEALAGAISDSVKNNGATTAARISDALYARGFNIVPK